MNYEKDMSIDESALDVEWLDQTALAFKYGRHWAECQEALTRAEEDIKLIRSELIKKAHEFPEKCFGEGVVKPTGPMVESYYRNHKRHQDAKDAWVKAQYEANVADIARKEISMTRKKALENLVQLHGQEYFAGPRVPRNLAEEREMKNKHLNVKISNKLKRTKT